MLNVRPDNRAEPKERERVAPKLVGESYSRTLRLSMLMAKSGVRNCR